MHEVGIVRAGDSLKQETQDNEVFSSGVMVLVP